jgi:aminoglycoside 3-N-acetyltransferase I
MIAGSGFHSRCVSCKRMANETIRSHMYLRRLRGAFPTEDKTRKTQFMDTRIEKLTGSDLDKFIGLIRLFKDVFEMKDFRIPGEKYLKQLLEKDDFFVFVALMDNIVVGGLTSYIMHQYYSTSPLVYIYDIAVKAEFQRKGIGKMLIAANNDYCREIGVEAVMVQADEPDGHAIEFYRSTGATAENVIHFEYTL